MPEQDRDSGGITGKFRRAELTTPFGKIPLTRFSVWALSVVVVVAATGWAFRSFILPAWVDWQQAKEPDRVLVDINLHVTRRELAEHFFDTPEWEFSPEGWPALKIKGYSDAVCYRWEGSWSVSESCITHPDKEGRPPEAPAPPVALTNSGASLSAPFDWLLASMSAGAQTCPHCGPYHDQFDHPPIEGRWWVCGQQGDWVTYCFAWVDGCTGWRRRHIYGQWEACFWWESCVHR